MRMCDADNLGLQLTESIWCILCKNPMHNEHGCDGACDVDKTLAFDMDVAANDENHKCRIYYTEKENGLKQDWTGTVWCNPPYGRNIKAWVKKASERVGGVTVMLLPVRTDTGWWQDYILGKADVRYIRGRIQFDGCIHKATFASAIVIFKGDRDGQ